MSSSVMRWTDGLNPADTAVWTSRYPFEKPWYECDGGAGPSRGYAITKRLLDVCVASVALVFAVPIVLLACIAIRLDSRGAAVFFQQRTGRHGRRFKMYKLRTMAHDAEELKERYRHLNELQWPDFKISDDPRVTRVGRFLRRTSIDELPQLVNVLRGDMTLVGPRPTSFSYERYASWHTARLGGKPGLTGLWQVSGRNELEFDERVRLDVAYLRNASMRLDLRILWRTFGAVFSGRGAS